MFHKQVTGTIEDIVDITGLPMSTVRRHRQDGVFSMDSFSDVVGYCAAYMFGGEYRQRVAEGTEIRKKRKTAQQRG